MAPCYRIPTALLCLLLASCSGTSLKSNIPLNRFDNPEAMGKKHGEVFLQTTRTVKVTHIPNIDEDPPRMEDASIEQGDRVGGGWTHGLMDRWDAQLIYPWYLKTKFQILGRSREEAKKNNFSLAVGAGVGVMNSVADDVEFDGDSNRAEVDQVLGELSLMAGWRPWEMILISASTFVSDITSEGELKTENDEKFKIEQQGVVRGWSTGLHWFFGRWIISGDYTRSDVYWSEGASRDSYDNFATRLTYRY